MRSKKIKWLIYTVMVGLIPIIARIFSWLITTQNTLEMFVASDFVAFGLVLHISTINEIEHLSVDPEWKTIQNGISVMAITFYGVLLTAALIGGSAINSKILLSVSIIMAFISTGLSYSIYYHLERIGV